MKVLILNTSERTGGAAIAANRLMKALRKEGVDVGMLVKNKQTDNPDVFTCNESFWKRKINYIRFVWERIVIFLYNKFDRKNLFRVSIANTGTDISDYKIVKDADIIHLHWINQGFLSLRDIKRLLMLNKPVVWTMHDMWPCTGICHHARECMAYRDKCSSCFYLNRGENKDLSTWIYTKKKTLYANVGIVFVTCSRWLAGLVWQSSLCKDKEIFSIPNPIDTSVFRQLSQKECRSRLGLPLDKKLLLFGAQNITDKQKGIDYLYKALPFIHIENIELVIFGYIKSEMRDRLPFKIHPMGYLNDEDSIVALYNAADVFITPSLEENLPNTIMESMACGTPCVGFNIGGIPEMIDHKVNGYVAGYKDANDLATGITWVLENPQIQTLSRACIDKVEKNYSEKVVAEKYISLYKELLDK